MKNYRPFLALRFAYTLLTVFLLMGLPGLSFGQEPSKEQPEFNELVRTFFAYDQAKSLNVKVLETQRKANYVREKIVFDGIWGSRVPGYIATPTDSSKAPFPCVLLFHNASERASKESWWGADDFEKGQMLVDTLLSAGYAVLMLDAQYQGQRVAENDYEVSYALISNGQLNRYREQMLQTTIEYRIAIDYLSSRSDIDATRIGAFGTSTGGNMILALASVDPRLKSVVVCSTIMESGGFQGPLMPFDPIYFNPANRASTFLIQVGKTDGFSPEEKVNRVYKRFSSVTSELRMYDFGHGPSEAYIPDALAWLHKYL